MIAVINIQIAMINIMIAVINIQIAMINIQISDRFTLYLNSLLCSITVIAYAGLYPNMEIQNCTALLPRHTIHMELLASRIFDNLL